jgi:hypothetical protein
MVFVGYIQFEIISDIVFMFPIFRLIVHLSRTWKLMVYFYNLLVVTGLSHGLRFLLITGC